ncbi:MAG: hypothetical protein AAF633_08965 [Chloroflexota bacterium]
MCCKSIPFDRHPPTEGHADRMGRPSDQFLHFQNHIAVTSTHHGIDSTWEMQA